MKQQLMEQLDERYDAHITLLRQQKRGMRLALKHMIDYQLHRMLESLAEKNCSQKLHAPTTTKCETNSLLEVRSECEIAPRVILSPFLW